MRKIFFEVIDRIFKHKELNMNWLAQYFVQSIRNDFKTNPDFLYLTVRKALKTLVF